MHLTGPAPDLGTRVDQAIAQALVVAFGVIVLQELANGSAQRCFAEEDQALETLLSLPKTSSWQRSGWVNRSFVPARRMRGSRPPLPRRQQRYPRRIPQQYALRWAKRGQGILLRPAAGRDTDSAVTGLRRWQGGGRKHMRLFRGVWCVLLPPWHFRYG